MTVGELIERLQKYPAHFDTEVILRSHDYDSTREIIDVLFECPTYKKVSLEIPARLLIDGEPNQGYQFYEETI